MRAFVTGITGFAGTHLTEHLQAGGDFVLGCSRDGRWRAHTPAALRSVPLVAWDVTVPVRNEVRRALVEFAPDCIFHLAAVSVPRECGSGEPTPLAWQANVEGTQTVLRLAATLPRRPRVLLASSCHVYAPVTPDQAVVREDAPLGPAGGYGKTKLVAESELLRSVAEEGLDGVIARAFQHAGPRQDPRLMLSEWCRQIIDPQPVPVRVLSLNALFDLSDVRDVVRAYRLLSVAWHLRRGVQRRQRRVLAERRSVRPAAGDCGPRPSGPRTIPRPDAAADCGHVPAVRCHRLEARHLHRPNAGGHVGVLAPLAGRAGSPTALGRGFHSCYDPPAT